MRQHEVQKGIGTDAILTQRRFEQRDRLGQ